MLGMRHVVMGLLVLGCAVSCGPSWEEIKDAAYAEIDSSRPETEALLAKLSALGLGEAPVG